MSKRVVAILGGPHKNGITANMLNHAVNKAEKCGYTVDVVHLYEKNIRFCTGCRACMQKERCVIMDDIQPITDLIKQCDILIISAPVYWANVPAAVKNLFDRLFGAAMLETKAFPKPRLKGKKYIILTSCDTRSPFSWIFGQSRGIIHNIDEFCKTAGMKPIKKVVCADAINTSKLSPRLINKIESCFK